MNSTSPEPSTPGPAVEILAEDLYKAFGDNSVLRGVSLTVRRGEMLAIVGKSGSGKTVLLQHIIGHLTPDRGRVLVADHESVGAPLRDLSQLDEDGMDRIRKHWAIVFQRNALLTGTVFYNLALLPREIKGMDDAMILPLARNALREVGLDPDEVMYRAREDLSGGMAKRVAIARGIVMDPVLIMYDEPTSGLDPELSAQIHSLISQTHAMPTSLGVPRTSMIVTHDTELLRSLRPRVVMIHDGKVNFDGPFEQFIQSRDPQIAPYIRQMPLLHERVPLDR